MSKNAIAKRAWREKQAQNKLNGTVGQDGAPDTTTATVADAGAPVDGLNVTVAVPAQSNRPPSLKERFLGKKQVAPVAAIKKTPAKANNKKQVNLISSTLPTIIAGLIATYVQELLPEDYKPCAPSKAEASAVLGPLFEIIGRRVEVVGKASEDAIDLANAFLAGVAYGARAYVMYIQIKRAKEKRHESTSTGATSSPTRLDDYRPAVPNPAASNGTAGIVPGGPGPSAGYLDTATGDVAVGGAADSDGDLSDRDREALSVSSLFKRDIAGRRAIGLLPVPV